MSSCGADEFGGVDHAALEGGVDLTARREDRRGTRPGDDLAAEVSAFAS